MNIRSAYSQSPGKKCQTTSQNYTILEKPFKSGLKVQDIKNRYGMPQLSVSNERQVPGLRSSTQNSILGQQKKTSTISRPSYTRVLKTEMYNDNYHTQVNRVVHSRNEGITNPKLYQRKTSNPRQVTQPISLQKQIRSSSQAVDKENSFYYYADKKKFLHTRNTSLNSSFNQGRILPYQQSITPSVASKKSSLHNWANSHHIQLNSTKSTRKPSVQSQTHTNTRYIGDSSQQFSALDNSFAYQVQNEYPSMNKNISHCYKLIEDHQYQEALTFLKEIDDESLSHAQIKDVAYLKGLILLTFKEYSQAILQFNRILQNKNLNEKNDLLGQISLLAAVAYKKLQNSKEAISVLTQFINRKGGIDLAVYYDSLIYRGKLYVKMKDFNAAQADFQAAMSLPQEDHLHQGKFGKADALRLSGRKQEALILYNSVDSIHDLSAEQTRQVFLRKVMTLIEIGKYPQALETLEELLHVDPINSDALYLKGVIQQKLEMQSESILSFEQAIKQNNSRKAVTKSLVEIAKVKIEQRDFYAAYYTLQRAQHLDVDVNVVNKMLIFSEGVVYLMKRKYQDGVVNFTTLINNHQLGDFIRSLVFIYRAYGYICLSKYQKALNDLTYLSNIHQLEPGAHYNKIICEGIIQTSQNLFEKAISTFSKAAILYPGRMEPYFYKSMTLMKFVRKHLQKDDMKSDKYIKNALQQLDQAVTLNDTNSNLLFHRGLLRFYFMRLDEALQDFNKCIEKSEENVAKYFYVRGLASACIKNEKQALSDFTVVINLDSKNADAYLNRAKVFQMIGDRNSAFNDLQKFISLKPHDPDIHLWAGNLLFNIGAYDNAVKAYSHSNEIVSSTQLLTLRAHCYIILKELNSALIDLSKIIELTGDKAIYVDRDALQSLKTGSMGLDESQQHLVQKLKPKKNREGLNTFRVASAMIKKLISINSDGLVFKQADLYFYRGVNKFYLKCYEKAIENWTIAYTIKQENSLKTKKIENKFQSSDVHSLIKYNKDEFCKIIEDTISKGSVSNREFSINEMEDFEFEDRTFNMYEYYYNVIIAYIQLEKYSKALELLTSLLVSVSEPDQQVNVQNLMVTLQNEISFSPFKQTKKPQQVIQLIVFPSHNRLCCIFPSIQLNMKHINMEAKLSFCLPKIIPPSMHPEFDNKLIENLSPEVVENKPEAPWIKRNQDGVVFTDNLQDVQDLDLKSESQRSEMDKSNRDGRNKQFTLPDDEDNDFNQSQMSLNDEDIILNNSNIKGKLTIKTQTEQSSGEVVNKQKQIERLKQQLQLDVKVQAKLANLK